MGHPTAYVRLLRPAETRERSGPRADLASRDRPDPPCGSAVPERGRRPSKGGLREPRPPRLPGGMQPGTAPDLLRSRRVLRGTRRGAVPGRRAQRRRSGIVPGLEPEVLQFSQQHVPPQPVVVRQGARPDPRPAERQVEGRGRPDGPRDERPVRRHLVVLLGSRRTLRHLRLLSRTQRGFLGGWRPGTGRIRDIVIRRPLAQNLKETGGFPRGPTCIRPPSGRSPRSDFWRKAVTT